MKLCIYTKYCFTAATMILWQVINDSGTKCEALPTTVPHGVCSTCLEENCFVPVFQMIFSYSHTLETVQCTHMLVVCAPKPIYLHIENRSVDYLSSTRPNLTKYEQTYVQ